jgi:uncharacterized protein (DUF1810 family)
MPLPQQEFAVRGHDPSDPLDLARIVSLVVAQADRSEPERRHTVAGSDVDVRSLERLPVLMGEEIEAVGTKSVDRGHAYLVDQVDGAHMMTTVAALALIWSSRARAVLGRPGDAKDGIADGHK